VKLVWAAAMAGALSFCHRTPGELAAGDGSPPQSASATVRAGSAFAAAIDPILHPEGCTLGYRGVVLDVGDASTRERYGARLQSPPVEVIEREGATWARVHDRSIALSFFTHAGDVGPADKDNAAPAAPFVQARIRGGAAKSVSLTLDGKLLGTAQLAKGEARVVAVKSPSLSLTDGEHELFMRFAGAPRATSEPMAEIDWVHIGVGEPDERYAAPTRADTLVSGSFAGEPMRALSLRAPGFARCEGWIPSGGTVEASLSLAGGGAADVEVRIVRDRVAPVVLGSVHVTAADSGERRTWPVGDLGSPLGVPGALELVGISATKGTRVLFGEPRVVSGAPVADAKEQPPARGLVLVVLGEMASRSLSVYAGSRPTPELLALAANGVTFEAHRATTGLAAGAMASMLTGLAARQETLDTPDGRLPSSLTTVAEAARQAGVATAMFTANPTTFAPFGFDRGWSTFAQRGPTEDLAATKVFDDAAEWIDSHKAERFLVLVHARGGHPPWDVTPDELKSLDPPNYGGGIDGKHAAELLARVRKSPGSIRYGDADRARAWALYALAVDAHDAALGRLVAAVRTAGRDADTTFIVTGDVGVNDAAHVPFAEADSLEEAALWVPLIIRPAGAGPGGKRVSTPTSGEDIGRTVLDGLGLAPPKAFGGIDLLDLAAGRSPPDPRPFLATLADKFTLRWGTFVLLGQKRRETRLCDLALEPACLTDVRPSYPLAVDVLHGAALDALVTGGTPPAREPATIDSATSAALRAWGR
jgi:arylsulfatase A-like enzyme